MRVYEVEADVDHFMQFVCEDEAFTESALFCLDGTPRAEIWTAHKMQPFSVSLECGDFSYVSGACSLLIWPRARKILRDVIQQSGELLPVDIGKDECCLLNVTECVDCLDERATVWVYGKETRKPIRIKEYGFVPSKLPQSSLFKIPERRKTRIYATEGLVANEQTFKWLVEANGLRGLLFKLIWSNED